MKSLWFAVAAFALTAPASAQAVDFGSWCADVAHFDADRCLENRPEDREAYDAYVSRVALFQQEKYDRDEERRLETERTDRMGEVTPDQIRDRGAAAEH